MVDDSSPNNTPSVEHTASKPSEATHGPLFGASPPASDNDPRALPALSSQGQGGSSTADTRSSDATSAGEDEQPAAPSADKARAQTSEPLFGATPPAPGSIESSKDNETGRPTTRERVEAGSRERVGALKAARDAALGQVPIRPPHSLQPASSSRPDPPPTHGLASAPPLPHRPSHPLLPTRPSPIPTYLRRLTSLLSLLLGLGATLSGLWSLLLLPLLHASFSARRALVEQQRGRMEEVVRRLREIKGKGVYSGPAVAGGEGADQEEEEARSFTVDENGKADRRADKAVRRGAASEKIGNGAKRDDAPHEKGMIAEKTETRPQAIFEELSATSPTASATPLDPASTPPAPPLIPALSPLSTSLRLLATTRANTSTTRTSLLSTLEAYTSSLHRQLWSPRAGHGGWGGGADPRHGGWGSGVGLGSLSANLAKERGGRTRNEDAEAVDGGLEHSDRGEEWDAVRKEVRAIKGMLLNRRNFEVAR